MTDARLGPCSSNPRAARQPDPDPAGGRRSDASAARTDVRTPSSGPAPEPRIAARRSIGDQISHLAFFDDAAIQSATDPEGFAAEMERAVTVGGLTPDEIAGRYRNQAGAELLAWFDASRRRLITVFGELDPAL